MVKVINRLARLGLVMPTESAVEISRKDVKRYMKKRDSRLEKFSARRLQVKLFKLGFRDIWLVD